MAGQPRARTWVGAALVVGVLLRAGFALGYWVGQPLSHDEIEYLRLGQSLSDGRGFTYGEAPAAGTSPRFGRAPLYPLFLAGILRVAGPAFVSSTSVGVNGAASTTAIPRSAALVAIKIAQALLGGLSICLIAAIARRAAGPAAAVAAAWLTALYPPLVWIGSYVLSEALFIPLALAAVLVLETAVNSRARNGLRENDSGSGFRARSGARWALAAGILAGLSTLTRPLMLFFLVAAGGWLAARRQARWLVVFALGAVLVVAPWTLRNYRVTGHFVLVASEGGVTFWTGNNPLARGEGDLAANPELKRAEIALRDRHPGWTAEQLEPMYYREAFQFIGQHPGAWASLLVRKLFYTVVPIGPSYRLHSNRYFWASVVSYGLLLPFAAAGVVALRRRGTQPVTLWLLAASSLAACLVFFPQERFRIPVFDPTLIVCAAAWTGTSPLLARATGAPVRLQE